MYDITGSKRNKITELWGELGHVERAGHLPRLRTLWEIVRLRRRHKISPVYYLLAGLYRRELSWQQKLDYMNEGEFKDYICTINPKEYQYVVQNKILAYSVFTMFDIPTAPLYGVVDRLYGETWDGKPFQTAGDLLALLERLGTDEVCFKFVSGTRGKGFYKVKVASNGSVPVVKIQPKGEEVGLETFWDGLLRPNRFDGYFCQGVVVQHPEVAQFNPWSLNTARCWMVKGDDGDWFMYGAALRMGLGETSVDNMSAGGLGAPIDVETGRISAAHLERPDRPRYEVNPATGVRFEGVTLPNWSEAVALCKRAVTKYPYFELLAADIAFGVDGPLVMELGATPDEPQLYFDRGVRPLMESLLARRRGSVKD